MSGRYRKDWPQIQRLRDEGVSVEELASRFKVNPISIYTQTRKLGRPSKWRNMKDGETLGTNNVFTKPHHQHGSTEVEKIFSATAAQHDHNHENHNADAHHAELVKQLIEHHERGREEAHAKAKRHDDALQILRAL